MVILPDDRWRWTAHGRPIPPNHEHCVPTQLEAEILQRVAHGASLKQIGVEKHQSPAYAKHFMETLYRHWGVSTIGEAVAIAMREGYVK